MTPTRSTQLLGLALAAFGLVLIGTQAFDSGLRRPPVTLVVTVTVAAVAVAAAARSLRTRLAGTGKPVPPLAVARLAALGIASAVTGALVAGGWLGLLADRLAVAADVSAARSDAVVAVLGAGSGTALAAAGTWLQRVCRDPGAPG